MYSFRRLRAQEAADAASLSIAPANTTVAEPSAQFESSKPDSPAPQKRTRKGSASAASTAEN
jgi:hypothetical protein